MGKKQIRLIIAGTRGDYYQEFFDKTILSYVTELLEKYPREEIEIVSGMADSGADKYAVSFAKKWGFELKPIPAEWDNLKSPGAVIKTNSRGNQYNARAGFARNVKMAEYGTHAIVFWDGKSPGSEHMLATANEFGLTTNEIRIDGRRGK